jgi:hypothetical protein
MNSLSFAKSLSTPIPAWEATAGAAPAKRAAAPDTIASRRETISSDVVWRTVLAGEKAKALDTRRAETKSFMTIFVKRWMQ